MDMLIDGGWTGASDGQVDPVLNPATNEQIDTVPRATAADVERAVAAAQRGKAAMAAMPAWRRYEILEAVARRIEENQTELGELLCRENGKRIGETTSEVGVAARIFRGYAEEAKRIFGRSVPLNSIPGREKSLAVTMREPLGVIAAIVPFNYPVELWSHKVAGGLAAGNAVITKTPEDCPLAVIEVSRYLEEAGLPRGAHQLAHRRARGRRGAGPGRRRADDRHDRLDRRRKTHPRSGGRDAEEGASRTRRQRRDDRLRRRRHRSDGRRADRRPLHLRQRPDLLRGEARAGREADLSETARRGCGTREDADGRRSDGSATDVGPLINRRGAERVEAQVRQAVADGAKIVAGGKRRDNFFEPTVLTGVTPGTPAFADETFGPVLPLIPYDSFEDALALANDSPFGLQAAIFTHDLRKVMRAYEVLDVGTVVVNHTTAVRVETLPFGGNKGSGNGREGIHDTLHEMSKEKTLLLHEVFGAAV